jgi:hypothetical protein
MNKLKKIRFEVISENIINNININQIEFGNLNFYSKNDRTNNISISTNLDFDLVNNDNIYIPKIHKIKLQGISGTRDQNPDIREFEFIGLGKWGTGDRRTGDYQIIVSTNISTAQYPSSPTVYLNNWVDGLITSHSDDNSRYLSGNNVSITDASYILFDLVGSANKPKLTDFDQFLIYYDRQDISIDSNQGKWKLIVSDENDIEHTVISTMTFYENNLITDFTNIYFLKFDTNIKSYYKNNILITNNTNNYNYIIDGDYSNNMLSIDKNNNNLSKFIEFNLDNTYNTPNLLNALSYTKIYWKHDNYVYTEERLYPSEKARFHYFGKIDGDSPDVYNIKYSNYANGYYEIHYSTKYHSNNHSPHYVFSSKNETYHNDATWANNQYNLGKYIGNHNFANLGHKGDWITIKMPVRIIPTKIRFVSILFNSNYINRLPKKYRLYGYYENKWDLIINDEISDDYEYESYNSISNIAYTKNITTAKNYNYFSLIVNEINGANVLAMSNFEIFGREILNNNNDIFSLTGFNNWLKIKHLPARNAGSAWYSGNTFNLLVINGTYTIGNQNDNTQEWAISFNPDNVEYYLFITRDSHYDSEYKDRWIMIESDEIKKYSNYNSSYAYSYGSVYIHHYKSSINPNGFQDKTGDFYEFNDQIMYNRGKGDTYDPNISIKHSKIYGTYTDEYPYSLNHGVFLESGTTGWSGAPPVICEVYVKYKEVNINELYYTSKTHKLQYDAETITKLDGWKLVRYLHNGMNAAFKSTDNLVGTDVYGNKDDFTTQWSIEFQSGNYDEYLFVGGNFEDWIIIHKDEFIPLNGTYNNYITALKSSINDNEHLVKAATDTPNDRPLIALTEWGDNKHLYQESETGTMQFGNGTYADRPYYMFVRKSNDYITKNSNLLFNNEKVYTSERMYPPVRNLTSSSHTISDELYGNGLYETNQSETYDNIRNGYSAFNTSMDTGPHFNSSYLKGEYNLNPPKFLVNDYYGDWITIKLPVSINLTKYGFKQRSGKMYPYRAPGNYKIYGSNDGIYWNELLNKKLIISNYSNLEFEESILTSGTYCYFGLVVNRLIGKETYLNFDEWYIYGKEEMLFTLYNEITNQLLYKVQQKSGKEGWRLVRYLPPNLGRWYSGNYFTYNNMDITTSLGNSYDYNNEFMVPFGTYDEIFFSTYDMTYWLYTTKEAVLGNYSNQDRNVIKSSANKNPHTVKWYNRSTNSEDPWISINDHTSSPNLMLYGDSSGYNGHYDLVPNHGGMCVFVRNSTDLLKKIISLTHDNSDNNHIEYDLILNNDTMCDILVVGGGGGGGAYGGGGGGGDVIYKENILLNAGNYKIKVGKGGIGGGSSLVYEAGSSGYYSSIYLNDKLNIIAGGGGGGNSYGEPADLLDSYTYNINNTIYYSQGGGGGGGATEENSDNRHLGVVSSYSGNGGYGSGSSGGGGGGGSEGNGGTLTGLIAGVGGNGFIIDITGEVLGYGGGGGGGTWNHTTGGTNGGDGVHGGGDGGRENGRYPTGGVNGTGGGGGGGGGGSQKDGANGGSGVVIIKIKYIYNFNYNNIQFKTSIFDNENNKIELDNTIINHEKLIHGIENGVITSYNITKYNLFKEERLYPPYYKSDILLFENFFIENKIYGNGNYSIEYSSNYNDYDKPFNVFRNNYYNGMWKLNNYTWNNQPLNTLSARSSFNGSTYIQDSTYKGDWITINLPYKIILTKFIIVLMNSNQLNISTYDNAIYYFPHNFRIYGTNDNQEWELIIHKNINKTNLNNKYDNTNNLNVAFEYKLSDNDRLTKFKTFEKFALVVSEIGGKEYLNFSKWDIYGKELNNNKDNDPDNIPKKKNVKFSQLSKVFDNKYDNKNIKITNYYLDNLDKFNFNTSIPNDGIISLSNFKGSSSFIDDIPLQNNIYARYQPNYESLSISDNIVKKWYDSSGNNRHIATYRGNPIVKYFEKGSKGTTGTNHFNVIYGDTNSGYKLPFRLNFEYTFCYVARYVGDKNNTTYNRRIFDSSAGTGQNTLWGFHDNHSGISHNYKLGWYTTTNKQHSETDYWMIGIETQNTSRYNGQDCTDYYEYGGNNHPLKYSDYNTQLTINYGYYTGESYSTETSNWEIAELIFYDKELNLDEKILVENYLAEKYGHISFNNVVNNLDEYKSIIKSPHYKNDLSDIWYYVYDGYKYGYSDITDQFYGPASSRFAFEKYSVDNILKYFWVTDFENNRLNDSGNDYTTSNTTRNSYNIKYNNIILADSKENYYVHMFALGGGGGGGKSKEDDTYKFSGGGGAGGLSYISNRILKNKLISLEIGSKGKGGTNINDNSAGGDTLISYDDVQIIGNGGYQGTDYGSTNLAIGGSYSGGDGGDYGGDSLFDNYNMSGGKISEVLKEVFIDNTQTIQFWNLVDEFNINWRSIKYLNSSDSSLYPGGGGYGARKYASHGNADLFGSDGGSGYAMIILDFNDLDIPRTSSIVNKSKIFNDYSIDFESLPGRANTPEFAKALGGNTNMGFRNNYHGWYAYRSRGHIWTIVPANYDTADVTIGRWSGTGIGIYIYRYATITSDWWGQGILIHSRYTYWGNKTFTFTDLQEGDIIRWYEHETVMTRASVVFKKSVNAMIS